MKVLLLSTYPSLLPLVAFKANNDEYLSYAQQKHIVYGLKPKVWGRVVPDPPGLTGENLKIFSTFSCVLFVD